MMQIGNFVTLKVYISFKNLKNTHRSKMKSIENVRADIRFSSNDFTRYNDTHVYCFTYVKIFVRWHSQFVIHCLGIVAKILIIKFYFIESESCD